MSQEPLENTPRRVDLNMSPEAYQHHYMGVLMTMEEDEGKHYLDTQEYDFGVLTGRGMIESVQFGHGSDERVREYGARMKAEAQERGLFLTITIPVAERFPFLKEIANNVIEEIGQ